MNERNGLETSNKIEERLGELDNLNTCQNMFVVEERARKAKEIQEKMENKANWEGQMRDKELRSKMDKLFY